MLPTGSTSTGDNNFGLVVEGTVSGLGVYDGVQATGLQIGAVINPATGALTCGAASTACGTTTLTGGLQVTGTVSALTYAASSTAIHIGAGATVPTLDNSGAITASILPANTTTSTFNAYSGSSTAIQIDAAPAGSTLGNGIVQTLINSGTISATATGDSGDAVNLTAVSDKGGGITSVINTGGISASFSGDAVTAVAASNQKVVALDLSANTTGATLTQQQAANTVVTATTAGSVVTNVVSTAAPTTIPTPGATAVTTTVTNGSTSVATTVAASPFITGDVLLGSGSNTVNILAGSVGGALSLGSGATGSVTIDNGAIYAGAFTYTGGALALNVNNGTFANTSPSASAVANVAAPYNLSSLKVGSTGVIYFGVDPVNDRAAEFLVSGAATIASGAKIGLSFTSNATGAETFTLVKATSLTVGETDTALAGPVPYIFNATITADQAAGTISLTISPKTAAQLGLNPSQSAALPATYQALTLDAPVQQAFLNQYSRGGFLNIYNQILPDYAGGTFQAANAASQAISRATSESNDIENPSGSRGAWVQELFVGVNQGVGLTDGFRGGGFGFVGGVETGGSGFGAFGTTAAFVTTSVSDPHVPGDSQTSLSELEIGGYWQGEFGGFLADGRIGAGYTWDTDRREIVLTNTTGDITLDRKVKSNWNGYTLSGRFGLAYKWNLNSRFLGGGWFVQPQTHLDYFRLNEDAYHDNEAQGGPALAMGFDSRTGQETSGTASIVFGRRLGTGLVWRPSLEVGVRDVFDGNAGDTTARFLSGGPSFTLTPADITGTAGIARFKLKASSEYYELGIEAGGEVLSSRYEEGDMKASIRVLF